MTLPEWLLKNDRRLWCLRSHFAHAAYLFTQETGSRRTFRDVAGVHRGLATVHELLWTGKPRRAGRSWLSGKQWNALALRARALTRRTPPPASIEEAAIELCVQDGRVGLEAARKALEFVGFTPAPSTTKRPRQTKGRRVSEVTP